MTRTLYICLTTGFWVIVFGLGVASSFMGGAETSSIQIQARIIPADELSRHASPEDCWMAIRGSVYDLGAYIPDHPTREEIVLAWCGKEATAAYETKNKGRPHSAYADELLTQYRIGRF
jgi:cytochrome b involved in lipid metabolism